MVAECQQRNDVRSLILDRRHVTSKLWTRAFSGATFRRIIFDAVSCGASSRYRHHEEEEDYPTSTSTSSSAVSAAGTSTKTSVRAILNDDENKADKLLDLLNIAEAESEAETKKKVQSLEELKRVVKILQCGGDDDGGEELLIKRKTKAASELRLLTREDSKARTTLAMLGAIPPLVGMLDSQNENAHIASLYALLNLGIANVVNKAAIVEAGAIHKMLKIIESHDPISQNPNQSVSEAIVANFLGLSALDANKPIIGSSGAIHLLANTLIDSNCSRQSKQDALRALYNLSIFPPNVSFILERTELIPSLLSVLGDDMESSERILSLLSNIVSTPEGRKSISFVPDVFPILVDVLNWMDSPSCQEKASYILMVMAHKAYGDRQAMMEAGIVSSLLELTLIGTPLAQKRASRILDCFSVDKGKEISENFSGNSRNVVGSAPIYGSSSSTNPSEMKEWMGDDDMNISDENKAVKRLVQQSLHDNMERIVKRANLPQDFVPSEHFKSLTTLSTSKSLPF
ncbi:U-box domain-containing protein 45 [Rutidosis leptorrhynchoides]|uniref:U-box domain-containing protein 45 n=1 Tax=Rutidosis leptorrhynchoides TaxID=125765 RepID=UPI003A9982CB